MVRCKDVKCRNHRNKAGLGFCSECKALSFRKFQLQKKVTNYILHSKINNVELFKQLFKGYNNKPKPISTKAFMRHVSVPYLRILLNMESNQDINSLLKDKDKYATYGTMINRVYVVWISLNSINYLFVPDHFVLNTKRKYSG